MARRRRKTKRRAAGFKVPVVTLAAFAPIIGAALAHQGDASKKFAAGLRAATGVNIDSSFTSDTFRFSFMKQGLLPAVGILAGGTIVRKALKLRAPKNFPISYT